MRLPWARDFHETLGAGATAMAPGMLADYPWAEVANVGGYGAAEAEEGGEIIVCDLGGGNGEFLWTLLSAHNSMRGALLEIGEAAAVARANFFGDGKGTEARFADVAARVVAVDAGDFFVKVPSYPVYTIRWTLHNWADEQAEIILINVRKAIVHRAESRLLVIESVVQSGRMGRPAVYGSVIMAAGSKGGRERTEGEWRDLCGRTGWSLHSIHRLRNCIPCVLDLRLL